MVISPEVYLSVVIKLIDTTPGKAKIVLLHSGLTVGNNLEQSDLM
jgi:hypothetical protein